MKCETIDELLLDYLEGALEPTDQQAVRAHIDKCDPCRRAVRETREMLDAMDVARRRQERVFKDGTRASQSISHSASLSSSVFRDGKILGDFEIMEELGRGGMGVVYRARQISLNRVVALKVLPGTVCTSESAVSRFRHEAQAAAKLHHTNIVPVYAQGEAEGHFYYAMELIEGPNLGRMLKEDRSAVLSGLHADHFSRVSGVSPIDGGGPQPTSISFDQTSIRHRPNYRRIARLIAEVADGLDHAHKANVIHRDIKPQNLLLGRDGQLHITDFGLARMLDEPSLTITGEMLGTPSYMSPEQIDADRDRIDHRTDVYSLGVTLYELLTGQRPFEGVSREQLIARIRDREPKSLRRIDAQIPMDLETICLRAMEKSPPRRYPSAGEFAADLRRYADNRPILSRRTGLLEKGVKWVKRHPAKFTIACLLMVIAVGLTGWTIQSRANLKQRQRRKVAVAYSELIRNNYRHGERAREMLPPVPRPQTVERMLYERAIGLSYVLEDNDLARAHVENALAIDGSDLESLYLMAWISRRSGDQAAFNKWLAAGDARREEIRGIEPSGVSPDAYFLRATAVVVTDPTEAMSNYEIAQNLAVIRGETFYQAILHQGRAGNYLMFHERTTDNFGQITSKLEAARTLAPTSPYPSYLLSLAYRIAAEINMDLGIASRAREQFDKSLAMATAAQEIGQSEGEDGGLRGVTAEAEFWASVSDRSSKLLELFSASGVTLPPWYVDSEAGLRKALVLRTRALSMCRSDRDRTEQYEYRWMINFWLGNIDEASDDIRALDALVDDKDWRKIWTRSIVPALIARERDDEKGASEMLARYDEPRDVPARDLVALACGLHLMGDADRARNLIERASENQGIDVQHPRWRLLSDSVASIESSWPGINELPRLERAEPLFVAACVKLGQRKTDDARALFRRCEGCYDYETYGYLARVLRRRMELDPAWPAWLAAGQP